MIASASRRCLVPGLVLVLGSACAPRPGPPEDAATCSLTFTDSGDVRVFVVGHAFRLDDAVSYETFELSVGETMAQIAPCRSQSRPNLVLFPESIGIIPWFGGRRAVLARGASNAETAFNAMYAGYYPVADRYRSRFPGISAARGLTLALWPGRSRCPTLQVHSLPSSPSASARKKLVKAAITLNAELGDPTSASQKRA